MNPPRFLAITPPRGGELSIDPRAPQRWLDAGLPAGSLALLLRDPSQDGVDLLRDDSPHAQVALEARKRGISVLLSLSAAAYEGFDQSAWPIDGVHVRGTPSGASDRPPAGRSAHEEDLAHEDRVALPTAYWTFAPVFPTRIAAKRPVGLTALRRACERLSAPVLALGGIDASNAQACFEAGAHGIAGISCFFGAAKRVEHDAGAFAGIWRRVLATT